MRIIPAALSFSLFLLAALAAAGPYGEARSALQAETGTQGKLQVLRQLRLGDTELSQLVEKAEAGDQGALRAAEDLIGLRSRLEGAGTADADAQARSIKASPLYRDEGEKEQSNWLSKAFERIGNLFKQRDRKGRTAPEIGLIGMPSWISTMMWFILGAMVAAFLVFAVRFMNFKNLQKRRAKALLDEDEPERTLDEWLALSEQYEREGRFREAVRALYLACLLRFDEHNVARFLRGQTNWEHLARIQTSPKLPGGLDFVAPTKAFDLVWYGHRLRGEEDVADFRAWYQNVTQALGAQPVR